MFEESTLYPDFTEDQVARLCDNGTIRSADNGEYLWRAGDIEVPFYLVRDGRIIVCDENVKDGPIFTIESGGLTGDIDLLNGRPAPTGGYAEGKIDIVQINPSDLREIVRIDQNLGGKILTALMHRQEVLLATLGHGLTLIGPEEDPQVRAIRTFLSRNRIVHQWTNSSHSDLVPKSGSSGPAPNLPVVLIGHEKLINPSVSDLALKLGIRRETNRTQYDLVIVGAGPAGLAAAVYGASEGLRTIVLDRSGPGGQASWSSKIENYMGFPEGLSGSELAARGVLQAEKFGADFSIPADVVQIECDDDHKKILLKSGETLEAHAVLIATGAKYSKLDIPGYARLERSGVYYAATALEADSCSENEVVVVGAGNSAGQAAVFLSQSSQIVRLVVRGDRLNKSMSDYLTYRIEKIPNIKVLLETEVAELYGDSRISSVRLAGRNTDTVRCDGLFVFIGATPNTGFVDHQIELDRSGFILTGPNIHHRRRPTRETHYLETSCAGIFAAGDCRAGSVKRVASSVGEGAMAITFIHQYLSTQTS